MKDLYGFLANLRRPRILVRAARHGLGDYNRKRDLSRMTGQSTKTRSAAIVENLIAQEEQLEEFRITGDSTYRSAKHIELLVAIMAECRLLPRAPRTA